MIAISLAVSLSKHESAKSEGLGKQALFYTLGTTVAASTVACLLYLLISPSNTTLARAVTAVKDINLTTSKYSDYVLGIIPSNILSPFLEHNVMGALLFGGIAGIATRYMPDLQSRSMSNFLKTIYEMLFIIVGWIAKILPVALFGFISTAVTQIKGGISIRGIGEYLAVVVLANAIQGAMVLPTFLRANKVRPWFSFKGMLPALSVAFFSKSSVGTLPVTMDTAEKNLRVSKSISRFVFPLCTAINMNGCAAFIFTTVIYVMQNNGIAISFVTLFQWILISAIAAIGNAGVPMGCFFLSMSLLTSMDVPVDLLWLILPFYGIIDMIETALNVWSDCCVVSVIDKRSKQEQ
jgi:Na+/H+-dicarboxylate symporter